MGQPIDGGGLTHGKISRPLLSFWLVTQRVCLSGARDGAHIFHYTSCHDVWMLSPIAPGTKSHMQRKTFRCLLADKCRRSPPPS